MDVGLHLFLKYVRTGPFLRCCYRFLSVYSLAIPPYVPRVSGPDDVSNFDVFERLKDIDSRYPSLPSKNLGFSGKSLPFIGFTFNRLMTSMDDYSSRFVILPSVILFHYSGRILFSICIV